MRKVMLLLSVIGLLFLVNCGGGSSTPTSSGKGSGPVVLQSIQINPSSAFVPPGTTQAFTATGQYSDGSAKDLTTTVQWSCLLPNLATVSSTSPTQGVARGNATGTVLITASSGSISNSARLTITNVTVPSGGLVVTPPAATIGFGDQQQFTATATFSDMSTLDVTNAATWTLSPGFITSDSGLAIGQTLTSTGVTNNVTARFGGQSAQATLTVDLSNLVSISVLPSKPSIAKNTQLQFAILGTFKDGSTRDVSTLATWSSSDTTVAFPSYPPGTVLGLNAGTTTITAAVGTLTASSTLSVNSVQLQSIAVLPANASLAPTTRLPLVAIGVFGDSSTQDVTNLVSWSVLDTSVASTSNTDHTVTGKSMGSTMLNARSPSTLGSIQGSTPLNVTSATLNSISVTPATPFMAPGGVLSFSAAGNFSDGSVQDVTALAKWTSGPSNTATIVSSTVTGQGIGPSTVTAKVGSLSATANLAVASPTQISLALSPTTIQIAGQTSTQLKATGTFVDGSTQDFTTLVNWTSSAPNVATVGYQTGIVSGLAAGQSTITATLGSVSTTTQVTVTNASLTSITLSPENPSIALGTSQQFTATGNFSDGTTQTLPSIGWSSSAPGVAMVNASGLATGTGVGTATISAAINSVSGSTGVTVH